MGGGVPSAVRSILQDAVSTGRVSVGPGRCFAIGGQVFPPRDGSDPKTDRRRRGLSGGLILLVIPLWISYTEKKYLFHHSQTSLLTRAVQNDR